MKLFNFIDMAKNPENRMKNVEAFLKEVYNSAQKHDIDVVYVLGGQVQENDQLLWKEEMFGWKSDSDLIEELLKDSSLISIQSIE
jgi:hypothetical protein